MKAIVIQPGTNAPRLVWEEVLEPGFGPGEVMVDVAATAVNRADLLQARGLYPAPSGAPEILGFDMSGVIASVGEELSGWGVGDSRNYFRQLMENYWRLSIRRGVAKIPNEIRVL